MPAKGWVASLKPLAIAAGLGKMGHHRMIIHPKFGTFMDLAAVFIDREITAYNKPTDYNPCLTCKLCAAVCPSGAVASDGHFDLASCITHNYREKIGGFSDRVENIVRSKNVADYRRRVWRSTLKKAGIEFRSIKQTRHSFATIALSWGENPL